jgi:hypothetical protein
MRIHTLFSRLILLLTFPTGLAFAQTAGSCTIHGYLQDSVTKDPWVGLTVNVEGTALGAYTDEHGSFTITLPQHPQTDMVTLIVRGVEMPERRLTTYCPLNSNLLEQRFSIADPTPKHEDFHAGPGHHPSRDIVVTPWHPIIVRRPPGEYYVDREGVVWRIGY